MKYHELFMNFPNCFPKFFSRIFHSYNHEKNPAWGARNTRVSRVRNPRNKSRKKFEENFDKKIWKKKLTKNSHSYNHEKNPAWGARNTRVSRVRNPRNKSRKNFEENFDKKIWKKKLKKIREKILKKSLGKKI